MKHIKFKILGISVAALALFVAASASTAHAQATTTPVASSTPPAITSVSVTGSADGMNETVSWLTDVNADSQVTYGLTTAYTGTTTLNPSLTTDHSVLIQNLAPSTMYHFQAISANASGTAAMSGDMVFTTNASSTGGTGTTTPPGNGTSTTIADLQNQVSALQADINSLQSRLTLIWQQLSALLNNGGGNNGGTGGNGGTPGSATIAPSSVNASPGSPIDFTGRNFGHEENVTISRNGTPVGSAHADGGGNFSTGSMSVPSTAGAYTYTFTGANSGTSVTSTVTVQ